MRTLFCCLLLLSGEACCLAAPAPFKVAHRKPEVGARVIDFTPLSGTESPVMVRLSFTFANSAETKDIHVGRAGLPDSDDMKSLVNSISFFLQETFRDVETQAKGNQLVIRGRKGSSVVDVRVTALDLPKDKQPTIRVLRQRK